MANLSYIEALFGVVDPQDMEALVGLVENHKHWGQFPTKMPSHIIVSLVDEIKRLREQVGGYKTLPDME
jgi:hypothetical protein